MRADIDLGAIRRNAARIAAAVRPASLCAVVKADGYGHGAVRCAEAAVEGGAAMLAVALVDEAVELRRGGVDSPILVLQECRGEAVAELVRNDLIATVESVDGARELGKACADTVGRTGRRQQVHIQVDTGMHRRGARPDAVVGLADALSEWPALQAAGTWTHLAVADDPSDPFTAEQLGRFEGATSALRAAGFRPGILHVSNTAGIAHPAARFDLVRAGIGLYGFAPASLAKATLAGLEPAMRLSSRVALVNTLDAGSRPSYGRRRPLKERSQVAVLPVGYADGVPWRLFECGGEVLIGGRRRPLAGAVTMDQIVVDCGAAGDVEVGDEAVLIGEQGDERITASEWSLRLGTIVYEVVTRIGPRVPRYYR